MEVTFENEVPPICVAAHPKLPNHLALGFIDGNIGIYTLNLLKGQLNVSYF